MADDNEEQRQPMFTFHGWKYGHYFDFQSVKNEKNITVRCKLCLGRKIPSTAKNTTSIPNQQTQHFSTSLTRASRQRKYF